MSNKQATEQTENLDGNAQAATPPPASNDAQMPTGNDVSSPPSGDDNSGDAKPKMRLGEMLVSKGLISDDQMGVALKEQKTSGKMIGATLVEMGFITESVLGEVLAESSGSATFDPKSAMLDSALVRQLPKDIATRHKVIPVAMDEEELKVAISDVYNVIAIDQIRRHFPRNIKVIPVYAAESDVLELIDQYYDYEVQIDGIIKEIETGIQEDKQLDGTQEGYVNPTVRLVNAILVDAIKNDTSDIHLEPEGSFVRIRYRIDGQLVQARSLHMDYWAAILVRIKIMSSMNIAETRAPQDGRIAFSIAGRDVDFRVATQPTVHGENIVLRLLDKTKALVSMDKLGYSPHNEGILKKLLKRPEGIIVVTGPTGSGKTTTLYSVLSFINTIDVNIMTLEDPVEYQLPLIRQTNVKEGVLEFATGVKSLLRQDPDIIFVGEVRDEETAVMAVRAALTGHQVFTSLHTNDALGAIPRLVDIGVPPTLLSGALIGVIAQRLSRRLCPHCKKEKTATEEECKLMQVDPAKPPKIYEAVGCEECSHRGYKGRLAVSEIVRVDKELDEMISKEVGRSAMEEHINKNGFKDMAADGVQKILDGHMDIAELVGTVDLTDRM